MLSKRNRLGKNKAFYPEIREKMGVTQAELAAVFGISRSHLGMVETKGKSLNTATVMSLLGMYLQFHELETGKQLSYRSLETKLFLNDEYRKILPGMKKLEDECRHKIKILKDGLAEMKEKARNAEHAIIVFTTAISGQKEQEQTDKTEKRIKGLELLKQNAYSHLLTCWEPEQAKLHGKIEAIAGEAKSLRRYRTKVMREHKPIIKTSKAGKSKPKTAKE